MQSNVRAVLDTNILLIVVALESARQKRLSLPATFNMLERHFLPGNAKARITVDGIEKLRSLVWDTSGSRVVTPYVAGEARLERYSKDHPVGRFEAFEILRGWFDNGWIVESNADTKNVLLDGRMRHVVNELGITDGSVVSEGLKPGSAVLTDDQTLAQHCHSLAIKCYDLASLEALEG